ncbi:MAG: 1,4-alpha-glucan branching enzyme [Desulfobacterales bacterium CG2_30_60_27]|nr:MAG: 1,4-alpha-glucan branching enzyme [Desulfobacterales bacterium CG2_30_60_27]
MNVAQELDRLIQSDQHNPHQVLGIHPAEGAPGQVAIRAFKPHADQMLLVIDNSKISMTRIREQGVFEAVITPPAQEFDYSFEASFPHNVSQRIEDPYRFGPLLSDFDQYLFNNGTHYEIYTRLGAHLLSVGRVAGTVFRVWAPSARRVSVIGNFNYWDGRVHQMRSLGGSGIWELFIPGIEAAEPYKFEIRTQGMEILEKADPYQFFAEVRPKTASLVYDLDAFAWQDDEWLNQRRAAAANERPISIYEVHLGSWQRDPASPTRFLSYGECADHLIPYVKEMGFTHIELLPIMEHPLDESWGYQVTGYYAATSRHGAPKDFMAFVDRCHAAGIGVLLDWVPSHFPTDGHSLGRFDGTALYEHQDPRQGAHREWGTLIFNYGRAEVKNFLIGNALFWLDKFHIDGLRVDAVASMLYLDYARKEGEWIPNQYGTRENLEAIEFLKHLNCVVYDRFPGTMMVAEESTSFYGVSKPAFAGGLGFGFKWNMGWMNDTLRYFACDPLFRKYHHNHLTFSFLYAFTENFTLPLSHDEVVHGKGSLLNKMPGDPWQQFANLRLLYLYMWAHPGKKLLFMGGEFGQRSEWYCKVSLDWHLIKADKKHGQLQDFIKALNHLYVENPALWEIDFSYEGFHWMDFKDVDNSIVAFARFAKNRQDHLVCLFNFTPQVIQGYRLGVPEDCQYQEILCSDQGCFGGSNITNPAPRQAVREPFGEAPCQVQVTVPPLGGLILRPLR